jgi:hypothetical protein
VGHDDIEDRFIPTLIDTFDNNNTTSKHEETNEISKNNNDSDTLSSCFDIHVDDIAAGQFYSLFLVGTFTFIL